MEASASKNRPSTAEGIVEPTNENAPLAPAVNRIDELVGNTPLVKLRRVGVADGADLYVKLENRNPSGSMRDRYIAEIVGRAVDAGQLVPGDTVTIAGLDDSALSAALLTRLLDLQLVVYAPEHSSRRLLPLIERHGARVEWTNEGAGLAGAIDAAAKWARMGTGRMYVDGYRRKAVREAYANIAAEILTGLHGRILGAFVTSVTTGGTFREVARELREAHPALKVGGAVLTDREFPALRDHAYNVLERVSLEEAWAMRDEVSEKEGLLLGPKGAACVKLAVEMQRDLSPGEAIVALNPDSGQRYLGWEDKPLFKVTYDPSDDV